MIDLLNKYSELSRAREAVTKLRREIREIEMERARAKLTSLPPHQRLVLQAIVVDTEDWSEYTYFSHYRIMCETTGLDRRQVRRALLALRTLGFAQYGKGLWTEDGEPAGSGWRVTKAGCVWWWAKEATRDNAGNKPTMTD